MSHPYRVEDSVVVVTGAASGIGRALATRAVRQGARLVVLADRDGDQVRAAVADLAALGTVHAAQLDVTDETAVRELVAEIESELAPIDLWCSNAGVRRGDGLGEPSDWDLSVAVHVTAHLHVARHVLPRMVARGRGWLLVTASAAGLLTDLGSAPYAVTKHAAVALAEWLAIRHDADGIGVSCLCPQGVRTAMNDSRRDGRTGSGSDYLDPEDVAADALAAMSEGSFLILPHRAVAEYEQRRAGDRERWLGGMRRLASRVSARSNELE